MTIGCWHAWGTSHSIVRKFKRNWEIEVWWVPPAQQLSGELLLSSAPFCSSGFLISWLPFVTASPFLEFTACVPAS